MKKTTEERKLDNLLDLIIEAQIKDPEHTPDNVLIISMSSRTLQKIMTPARLELIRIIKERKPASVGGLAKIIGRQQESVSRDLKILENYGVLEFLRQGKTKKPVANRDIFVIPA